MSSAGRGPTILTAGHGARSLDEFLAVLRDAGVHRLVDVRTAPGSRRHPQFGRDTLASALNQHGIAYAWKRDLGGFRIPKEDSPHAALRNRSFRGYADHMDTEAFHDSLVWLIQTSWEASTTVMCAERLWWRCHRRMLADAVSIAGCEVAHLMEVGRRVPHELSPALRMDGGRLIYDVGGQHPLAV